MPTVRPKSTLALDSGASVPIDLTAVERDGDFDQSRLELTAYAESAGC